MAAVRMVTALQELLYDSADTVRFTVGRFEVTPNSPNTVPGRVLFTIDLRHPQAEVLSRLGGIRSRRSAVLRRRTAAWWSRKPFLRPRWSSTRPSVPSSPRPPPARPWRTWTSCLAPRMTPSTWPPSIRAAWCSCRVGVGSVTMKPNMRPRPGGWDQNPRGGHAHAGARLSAEEGSVAKLPFRGKIRKSCIGKSMTCESKLSCFR